MSCGSPFCYGCSLGIGCRGPYGPIVLDNKTTKKPCGSPFCYGCSLNIGCRGPYAPPKKCNCTDRVFNHSGRDVECSVCHGVNTAGLIAMHSPYSNSNTRA